MRNSFLKKRDLMMLFILFFLFLFIFTPRLYMPFSVVHILTIISLYYLITKRRKFFIGIVNSPKLRVFLILHCFLIIYTFAINFLSTKDFSATYWAASTVLEVLPCSIFISILCITQNYDINKFYNIILTVGMLQVACVILSMIFPGLRNWMIESSGSPDLMALYGNIGMFRIYGLATGYTFTMPLYLGLCVILSFVLGMFRSYRYYFLIPFYLVSIAVNARIAITSLFIVSILTLVVKFRSNPFKQILNIILLVFFIIIVVQIVDYQAVKSSSLNGWVWFNSGIKEITNYYHGEVGGNLAYLTDSMWFMPRGINLLLGSGENAAGSDIGYVINLHYGGLVLSILLYLPYLWILMKYSSANQIEKIINLSIIVYLFIANAKGNLFMPNEVIKGVLILIVFSITTAYLQMHRLKQYQ
jgi:hypothetical protein